jgi:High-affinity nickel-transport protein.
VIDVGSLLRLGILASATVLGVTHGFEPDHAAGISALTDDTDGWRHAALVGASFAVGHIVVVLAWVVLLTFLGGTLDRVPGVAEHVGTVVPAVVLSGVALLLATAGVRRLRGRSPRPNHEDADGPSGRLLASVYTRLHGHEHETTGDYLRTGTIGSLFALSPPISMLALVATVLPTAGVPVTTVAVASYAVGLTVSMVAVGAGLAGVFTAASGRGRHLHGTVELVGGVVVFGFALQLVV